MRFLRDTNIVSDLVRHRRERFLIALRRSGKSMLYKHHRGGRIALWGRHEKFFAVNCTARSLIGCH